MLLACLYGQGATNMSKRMNVNIDYGTDYQVRIKNTYHKYFEWVKPLVNKALLQGYLTTKYGFRYYVTPGEVYNPRSFYNFPIQSHGSEMLRHALIKICRSGIELNALIHLDRKKFRKQFLKVKKIMEDASRKILNDDKSTNYYCPVEWQVFRTGMLQEEEEQGKWNRIINIIESDTLGENPIVPLANTTTPCVHINKLNIYTYDTL